MLVKFKGYNPIIKENVFVAPNSTIIGRCTINENSGIWFNAVIRADVNEIKIGKNTNIQDGCVLHCDHDHPAIIGDNVTVGHNAIIHGCTIGDNCIIGMGSTILDGAVIGKNCIVGANALVTSGKVIPDGSMVLGSPAKFARELNSQEIAAIQESAKEYASLKIEYV